MATQPMLIPCFFLFPFASNDQIHGRLFNDANCFSSLKGFLLSFPRRPKTFFHTLSTTYQVIIYLIIFIMRKTRNTSITTGTIVNLFHFGFSHCRYSRIDDEKSKYLNVERF
jgi:hypothetical protein